MPRWKRSIASWKVSTKSSADAMTAAIESLQADGRQRRSAPAWRPRSSAAPLSRTRGPRAGLAITSRTVVTRNLGLGLGTISSLVSRAEQAGLHWPPIQALADDLLEGRLYRRRSTGVMTSSPSPTRRTGCSCRWRPSNGCSLSPAAFRSPPGISQERSACSTPPRSRGHPRDVSDARWAQGSARNGLTARTGP